MIGVAIKKLLNIKNEGSTAIEFSLIAPVFFMLIMGIFEFGLIMFYSSIMEGATNIASRAGKSGFSPEGTTRDAYIFAEMKKVLEPAFGASKLARIQYNIVSYNDFSEVNNVPGEPGSFGGPGDVVVYKITYDYNFFTPLIGQFFGDDNKIVLEGVSVIRNEPYPDAP